MFLYPSEIARLVLGYLKLEGFAEAHSTFLNECLYLYEYKEMLRKGHTPKTEVYGCDLVSALNDYFDMKSRAISLVDEYLRNINSNPTQSATRPAMADAAVQTECNRTMKDSGTVTINPVKLKRNRQMQTEYCVQIQSTQTDDSPHVVFKDAAMMTTECLSETASNGSHLSKDESTLHSHGVEELLLTTPPRSVPIASTNPCEVTSVIPGGRNVVLSSTSPVKVSVDMFSVIESLLGKSEISAIIADNINRSLISHGDDIVHRNLMKDVDELLDMPLTEDDTKKIAEMTVNDPIFKSFIQALPIEITAATDSMSPMSEYSGQTDTNDEQSNHSSYSTHSNMSSTSNMSFNVNVHNHNSNSSHALPAADTNAEKKKDQQYTTIDLTSLRSLNSCSSFIQLGTVHAHVRQLDFCQKSPPPKRRRVGTKQDENHHHQQQQQLQQKQLESVPAMMPAAVTAAAAMTMGVAATATAAATAEAAIHPNQRILNLIDENSIAKISITEASQLVIDSAERLIHTANSRPQPPQLPPPQRQQQQKFVEVRGVPRVTNRRGRRPTPLNKKLSQKSIECKLQELDVEKILSKFYK